MLTEAAPRMGLTLPDTAYFEIDSDHVRARFAIWIVTPSGYGRSADQHYPVVFIPDGNHAIGMTIGARGLAGDVIAPIEPFVQVCIGYLGPENSIAVRPRDLLPPGEPLPAGIEHSVAAMVDRDYLSPEDGELYLYNLAHPRADRFLAFLQEELYPAVAQRYRLSAECGLFGYSYGGVFAAYAALRKGMFTRVGAGSPGVLARVSALFALHEGALARDEDFAGRRLHLTVCAREIVAQSYYQHLVGAGAVEFITALGARPLKHLAVSSRIIEHESHATGWAAAWHDFLRACYPARQ